MTDDPYAKYLAPPPSAPSSSPSSSDGSDPYAKYLNKPGEKPAADSPAKGDTGYKTGFVDQAINTATFHLPDYLEAGGTAVARALGASPEAAPDLAAIRKRNAGYAEDHPVLAGAADVLGYALGPGKLGVGESIAAKAGGGRIAQAIGSSAEGAGAAGLGSVTSGDDLETAGKNALVGGALAAPLGFAIGNAGRELGPALGRAVAKGQAEPGVLSGIRASVKDFAGAENAPPVARSAADLAADEAASYNVLKGLKVNPAAAENAVSNAISSLTAGEQSGLSAGMRAQINDTLKVIRDPGFTLTADDLNAFSRNLGHAQSAPPDAIAGARIGEALRSIYAPEQAAARQASARVRDAEWLDKATPQAAPGQAAERLANKNYIYGPQERISMEKLASYDTPMQQAIRGLTEKIGSRAAIAPTVGYVTGGLTGGLHGLMADAGWALGNKALKYAVNRPVRRAMKATRIATSTGQAVDPAQLRGAPWMSQAARQAVYGIGAGDDR